MRDLSNVGFNLIPDVYLENVCIVKGHSDFPSSMFRKSYPHAYLQFKHIYVFLLYTATSAPVVVGTKL